ncbi:interleukin-34 isoform X1 [Caretta caretta]|uniref:interleukin-34 isoform X1 n=1 Tax=Caretta caretta TaxID=8467 RepID=UPI00209403A1|nr:interleukin-34 isoform X1 [Caretta caretta]XP_048672773.1 interleukin-34 isoform X1 [Caretta caretta]
MQWGYAPFLYFVAVLGLEAAMQKECRIIEALQNKLTYRQRLQYMKHYFPINYTVNVQFEEVLKAANITRLRDQNVSELSLRYLWLSVNSQVLLKIWAVLLERHPSWEYTQDLCHLFEQLAEEYENYNQGNVDANVQGVVEQVLTGDAGSSQKAVPPKALLDNCVKVMWLLYSESWPRGSQHPTKHLPRCPAVGALPCSPREE